MSNRNTFIHFISMLLIALWVYTAISKGMDMVLFKAQLSRQPIPEAMVGMMAWALPLLELAAAFLLMFARSRWAGMLLSFSLMAVFTLYVGLAVMGYWENIPCSCGGVLNRLGWKDHLWFNLFFTALAGMGVYLLKRQRKDGLQQAAFSGEPAKG